MIRESKYAIFNFELCDENLINELMKYLDSNAYKIFQFFDVEIPSKKVPINIIPTKREFDKTYILKFFFREICSTFVYNPIPVRQKYTFFIE